MRLRELKFMLAFAEVHDMMNRPFIEVYEILCKMFDDMPCSPDEYIDDFILHYEQMKKYHLDDEIKAYVKQGDSFFIACREWDI